MGFGKTTFGVPFPVWDQKLGTRPKVIVTPHSAHGHETQPGPAVVPIVAEADEKGFKLVARNADCSPGEIGFDYMAVVPRDAWDKPAPDPAFVQPLVTPPRHFQADCTPGDWQWWQVPLDDAFHQHHPYVLLTATDTNALPVAPSDPSPIAPLLGSEPAQPLDLQHAPVIGLTRTYYGSAIVDGRNCGLDGEAALNVVAALPFDHPVPGLWVDAGWVDAEYLEWKHDPAGNQWRTWEVYFSDSFSAPPVVLLTAVETLGPGVHGCAPVGIVSHVTPYGFTLAARNSDCAPGEANFNWVAFGCPQCGLVERYKQTAQQGGAPPPPK